jgi:hypothetical protein
MDLSWRPVALALALAHDGVRFVVVGGTARHLLGGAHPPADLDVVVDDLGPVLRSATRLGSGARALRGTPTRLRTCFGPLDVFLGQVPVTRTLALGGTVLTVDAAA